MLMAVQNIVSQTITIEFDRLHIIISHLAPQLVLPVYLHGDIQLYISTAANVAEQPHSYFWSHFAI